MTHLRMMATKTDIWKKLFSTSIRCALETSKRLSGPTEYSSCTWITSDATLQKAAAINWNSRQFVVVENHALLSPFQRRCVNSMTIQHPELAIGLYGVVAWAELEHWGDMFLMCMDNQNAVGWVQKGKAVVGISREMLSSFLYYCVAFGIEPFGMMVRTFNNTSADFLSRCTETEAVSWAEQNNMTKVDASQWWEAFAAFTPVKEWNEEVQTPLKPRPCEIGHRWRDAFAEWNSGPFTVLGLLNAWGIQAKYCGERCGEFGMFLQAW